ncbi:SUMO-specific isopeptidase USPL1 [Bienertia sinuspersici]
MEAADSDEPAFKPAHLVTLSPIPSSTLNRRRLSSQFSKPRSPIRAGVKKKSASSLAWISLQGRLVGAEEATRARAVGGLFSREEAVAWELFSPIHRVLIVAVVAVAAAKCEKNQQIFQLRKCVQLRDEILMNMQQKLDDLCQQMNYIKDQPQAVADLPAPKIIDSSSRRLSLPSKSESICTDCWFCDQRRADLSDISQCKSLAKAGNGDEMFKNRLSISNEAEQEERRMSDLSDLASSVTSAADLQLNNLAIEQDTYNLKKECEDKDAAIKELSAFIRTKDVATSKRIEELEEVIRRKNTMITKLKKDMMVLEQKLVNLTRTKRRSFSGPASMEKKQLPAMTDNLLYDMESLTSSSDSDCTSKKQTTSVVRTESVNTSVQKRLLSENVSKRKQKSALENVSLEAPRARPVSPLKEKSLNQRHYLADSSKPKQVSANVGLKSNRRRAQSGSKDAASHKRWM